MANHALRIQDKSYIKHEPDEKRKHHDNKASYLSRFQRNACLPARSLACVYVAISKNVHVKIPWPKRICRMLYFVYTHRNFSNSTSQS